MPSKTTQKHSLYPEFNLRNRIIRVAGVGRNPGGFGAWKRVRGARMTSLQLSADECAPCENHERCGSLSCVGASIEIKGGPAPLRCHKTQQLSEVQNDNHRGICS